MASLSLAFSRFLLPFFFLERLFASFLNFLLRLLKARGLANVVPSERVARVFIQGLRLLLVR